MTNPNQKYSTIVSPEIPHDYRFKYTQQLLLTWNVFYAVGKKETSNIQNGSSAVTHEGLWLKRRFFQRPNVSINYNITSILIGTLYTLHIIRLYRDYDTFIVTRVNHCIYIRRARCVFGWYYNRAVYTCLPWSVVDVCRHLSYVRAIITYNIYEKNVHTW